MALTYSVQGPGSTLGSVAPDFLLRGFVPGYAVETLSLESFQQARALIVIFMCNHCPYVIAVQRRINDIAKKFAPENVTLIGINSNDASRYPADSFEAMGVCAREQGYVFPYLYDETQEVARAYDAVCTPDPYVYEKVEGKFVLRYHGRIDDNWKVQEEVREHSLANAVEAILQGKQVSPDQKPSMGCSIKWKSPSS